MPYQSTMNAQLSADESARIDLCWERLRGLCIAIANGDDGGGDPLRMLELMTDIIMRIYEVRLAINEGWNAANFRAFPGPRGVPKARPTLNKTALLDALGLGTTKDDDITAVLEGLIPSPVDKEPQP